MRIEVIRKRHKIPEGWYTAEEIEKTAEPGDIIEVQFGKDLSHFLLNIRKGWCVHVRPLDPGGGRVDGDMVLKDATDLREEAGTRPCRINNFQEIAESNRLQKRSMKDCLNLSRAGLATGPVTLCASDITKILNNGNIAQEFVMYWKYKVPQPKSSMLSELMSIPYLAFVLVVAALAAIALAFL